MHRVWRHRWLSLERGWIVTGFEKPRALFYHEALYYTVVTLSTVGHGAGPLMVHSHTVHLIPPWGTEQGLSWCTPTPCTYPSMRCTADLAHHV